MKGLNIYNIKQSNRASILYLLNQEGPKSRKDIAEALGLTKAALTKITQNLLTEGVISETEEVGTGVGRKEVLLALNYGDKKALGVTFERDEITLSICSIDGSLVKKEVMPFTEDFNRVKQNVKKFYLDNKEKYNIIGCGISIIGLKNDYVFYKGINIKEALAEFIDIPMFVKNNVQAFSLAQIIYGNLEYDKNLLIFKWGPGIGSSFIRENKVLSGDDSGVAEIGHVIVNPKGKLCRCGRRGCLETETALDVILNDAQELGYLLSIDEILDSNDERIVSMLETKIDMVCLALLNTSTVLNANQIVLFGSVFNNKNFLNRFYDSWNKLNPSDNKKIVLSSLNEKSSYIGSAATVSSKLFFEGI